MVSLQYDYSLQDTESRAYREITMPTGITFRMYEDTPYVWTQVKDCTECSWALPMFAAWQRGDMKVKK
jgi:hypothetical protein